MAKKRSSVTNRILVAGMMAAGGALFAYALFHNSSNSTIPGWVTVNGPLKKAMETLQSTQEPNSAQSTQEPKSTPITKSTEEPKSAVPTLFPEVPGPIETASSTVTSAVPSTASSAALANANAAPKPSDSTSTLLDLNKATQSELETLPSIGPSKAKEIIKYREQHDGFRNVEQLLEVKGIGQKILDRVSKHVRVSQVK